MKRLALLLALIATSSALLPVGSAAAVTTAKSTVTITSGEGSEFKGKVTSAKKQCRANRKVTLFRKSDSGGADSAVGTGRTNASGAWTIEGAFIAGYFYAKVASALIHVNGAPIRCNFDVNVAMRF
jgi:hypothetical protein